MPPPRPFLHALRKDNTKRRISESLKNIANIALTNTKNDLQRHASVNLLIEEVKQEVENGGGGGGSADLSKIASDLIPLADELINIGTDEKPFDKIYVRDIFTSENTIHIGDKVNISATADGKLALPIGTTVGGDATKVNGVSVPLADKWVLSKDEISEISSATDAYNLTIKGIADANPDSIAFVDTKIIMNSLTSSTGLTSNGFTLRSTYVTGGAFSLDGVHPSPRGYALIANEFIKAINAKYGSNLKGVDLGNYRILFPANPQAF